MIYILTVILVFILNGCASTPAEVATGTLLGAGAGTLIDKSTGGDGWLGLGIGGAAGYVAGDIYKSKKDQKEDADRQAAIKANFLQTYTEYLKKKKEEHGINKNSFESQIYEDDSDWVSGRTIEFTVPGGVRQDGSFVKAYQRKVRIPGHWADKDEYESLLSNKIEKFEPEQAPGLADIRSVEIINKAKGIAAAGARKKAVKKLSGRVSKDKDDREKELDLILKIESEKER
jgi:hypothetical protein